MTWEFCVAVWQADFPIVLSRPLPPDYAARLSGFLAPLHQLIPQTATWGTEDGHRIDFSIEASSPVDGLLRLDMRAWDPAFLNPILMLLREWGCKLAGKDGRLLEPVMGEIALAARSSPAFRFVDDPTSFLRRVELGGWEDA
jgi:hypothetical protein